MKKTKALTVEKHRAIAAILQAHATVHMSCEIQNTYGKSSRAGMLVSKYSDTVAKLKSEMEAMCFRDGHKDQAMDIYYPPYDP